MLGSATAAGISMAAGCYFYGPTWGDLGNVHSERNAAISQFIYSLLLPVPLLLPFQWVY